MPALEDPDKLVYLIQHELGPVKIGVSKDPRNRLLELQTGPFELRLIGVLTSSTPALLERALHDCYSEQRLRGEWFELDLDDIERIFSNGHSDSNILASTDAGEYVEEYRVPASDPEALEYTKVARPVGGRSLGRLVDRDPDAADRRRRTLMRQGLIG